MEQEIIQNQIAIAQLFTDIFGYTGTILAALAIAIPLMLRPFLKEPEKHTGVKVIYGITVVSIALTLVSLVSAYLFSVGGKTFALIEISAADMLTLMATTAILLVTTYSALAITFILMLKK